LLVLLLTVLTFLLDLEVYLLRRLGMEAEAEDTIVKLLEIDPMRIGCYRYLLS